MQKLTKRLFALLLAAVMVVGLLPVSAFAARVTEDVTAEVPMGEEAVSVSLDAGEPAPLAADSLTIPGYTRVAELPEGGLEEGYYLFIAPYNGSYYMLYPGAEDGGAGVTNSARLEVNASGAATGYKVGAGTSYNSATVSTDFSLADNLVTPRNESNSRGALYAATAVGPSNATYYLCKKGATGAGSAIYHATGESAFTIYPLDGDNDGCFNLRHEQGSYVLFYTTDMNFNQLGSIGTHGGVFMIFKSDTKTVPLPTDELRALITEAQGLTQGDYTPKTWAELQTALAAAQTAVGGTDRQAMKDAIAALTTAKNGLQAGPAVETPPAATITYPEATADIFEDGVYTVLGKSPDYSRTVILHNSSDRTDQLPTSAGNGQPVATTSDLELWRITKVTDTNTPDGACAVTIQGVSNNKYITSNDSGTSSQRALSDSSETFYLTKTTGNTYEIKSKAGQYFSFLDNTHWGMSTAGTVTLYKQTTTKPQTAAQLRPAGGTTTGQPFPSENGGLAGGTYYRIPTIVTVKGHSNSSLNGNLVAATDMRWNSHLDSSNIDTVVSYSTDNGATWNYSFVNFFGDVAQSATANKSALFIDPLLTADNSGNLYLMVNAFPQGVSTHSSSYQRPETTTGFQEIDGVQRMTIYTSPENSAQDDDNYSYYIGDFAAIGGSTTKYAPILDAYDGSDSGFYTDDHFNLYQKSGAAAVPANDIIYCKQLGEGNRETGVWVQQNLFYWNATLHVRNSQFLYMIKSTDGGRTWSAPTILNPQVRTGEHVFYGPGPGAGICLTDGTLILPTYQFNERSSFIYSTDNGASWKRGPSLTWESTENMIVQIDDNTIRQFYRNRNHDLYYADYTRANGVWTACDAVFTGQQKQGNNQISALRYSGQIDGKTLIFVSTASNTSSSASGYARKGGKVIAFSLNEDNTMTYLSTYRINDPDRWYGYSSLTQLATGDLGIIYENSQTDGNDTYSPGYCGLTYFSISPYAILLSGLVERAEGLNPADYIAGSLDGLTAPLATAKAVLDGTDKTTTLEAAYTGLNNAIKALKKVEVTISGTVTASDGTPVANATVTLEDNNYSPVGLTATTNASGAFTFDNNNTADVTLSTAASYKLKVQGPGFTYKVTTVAAAAFNAQKLSTNAITLEAQPAATYTNTFDSADSVAVWGGLDGSANPPTATWQNGAARITMKTSNREQNNIVYRGMSFSCGTVSFDLTPLSTGVRTGVVLRATGGASRVYAGTFDTSIAWGWEYWPGTNQYGNGTQSGVPKLEANVTRHVEVSIDSGKKLIMTVDGVKVIEQTLSSPPAKGFAGLVSSGANAYLIDNFYISRTDPKYAVTLNATGGTLTGKVLVDGQGAAMTGGAAYEGDTVVITGTGETGKCLGGITLSDSSVAVTKTAVEGGGYEFSFVMPASAVTVTGSFKTAVTGAKITGDREVGKTLAATALAGETEIPATSATYQWYHRERSGSWTPCTNGTAQTKAVTAEDQSKLVKVRVEGTGDYAGWFETTTDTAIGSQAVETIAVTISRDNITLWKNLDDDPDASDNTVMGNTVQLTAAVNPPDATNQTITWTSDNTAVATVSGTGLVTAVGNGTTAVKAEVTSADGTKVSDTVTITVKTGITGITLTKGGDPLAPNSVLTIYANNGDPNQSVTVNAAVNAGASAADLVWSCGHDGDDHIFQLGGADDAGAAAGGSVAITAYNSHSLVGEETVRVSAPNTTGNTAAPVTFKVMVVHKINTTEHTVSIAGTPKVGTALSVNLNDLPMSETDKGKLTYQWKSNGTDISGATGATYTPGADDVGKTISVVVTATPATGFYYEGSMTSAATAAVEKKDGPNPPTLSQTPVNGATPGKITISSPVAGATYEYSSNGTDWDDVTLGGDDSFDVPAAGSYQVRIQETDEQKAGTPGSITVEDATKSYHTVSVTSTPAGGGSTLLSATSVEAGKSVTLTVTPNAAYTIGSVTVGGSAVTGTDGANGAKTYTQTVNGDVAFVVTFTIKKVTITHSLSNLTCDVPVHTTANTHVVDYGTVETITLTAAEGCDLPATVRVTTTDSEGNLVDTDDAVSYSGGTITFANGVTQDITITATATAKTFNASFDPATGGNLTRAVTSTTPIAYNGTLTATLTPATGYSAPAKTSVQVTVGGTTTTGFGYDVDTTTGVATVTVNNVKGNVVIKAASAVRNTTQVTAASISGAPTVGNTLSVTDVEPSGAAYSVVWQRADTQDGTYAQIAATDTYLLTADDAGKYFKAVVSGTGDHSGEFTTDPVGPVTEKVVPATGVTITGGSAVVVGSTLQLTATVAPTEATINTVKWSSGNTSVATVNEATGVVTPVKVGTVSITATVINSDGSDGVTDSVDITVTPAPIALRLTGSAVETKTLSAELTPAGAAGSVQIRWYRVGGSEDLLLDNNDQTTYTLTADDIGYWIKVTASVPGSSESNYTGSAEATTPVEVVAVDDEVLVEGVSLDKDTASVAVGNTVALTATVQPANATNQTVSWGSNNEPVATVDQNGVVTGVTEGTAVITVRTADGGFTSTCTVTVTAAADPTPEIPIFPGIGAGGNTGTTTTTNPDGSTTTTVTDTKTGTVTETTKKGDGTVETKETLKDGTVTETTTNPDGSSESVETRPDGTVTETAIDPEGAKVEKVTTPEKDVAITVTDKDGEELAKVELPNQIPAAETRFVDVPVNHWADEAIHNMAALEVVNGVGGDRFDMGSSMTRGALATVLSRLSHGQEGLESSFADVTDDKWYADGIAWAAKTGVVTGYSATEFGPNDAITREQLAVMLCRYARLLGMDTTADTAALDGFNDGSNAHGWAADSIAWCVDNGIINGMGNGALAPTATATRAQVAVMLQRFIALIRK